MPPGQRRLLRFVLVVLVTLGGLIALSSPSVGVLVHRLRASYRRQATIRSSPSTLPSHLRGRAPVPEAVIAPRPMAPVV